MEKYRKIRAKDAGVQYKSIVRILLVTGVILLIPLVAMQFTDEVRWDLVDFVVMGALLVGLGLAYELMVSKLNKTSHRVVIGIALVATLFLVWVELAVGIFD